MADSTGIITSWTYDAYGKATYTGVAQSNPYLYTGRELDGTGLYYYRARYYHPVLSRFVSEDPIGLAAGPNVYAYVGGNPVSYSDALGLDETTWATAPERSVLTDGPRNGNWGGGNWSGGTSPGRSNVPSGMGMPTDSADACYMRHDLCYDSGQGKKSCDKKLVDELRSLPADPRNWPMPPRAGTEQDSVNFLNNTVRLFK